MSITTLLSADNMVIRTSSEYYLQISLFELYNIAKKYNTIKSTTKT